MVCHSRVVVIPRVPRLARLLKVGVSWERFLILQIYAESPCHPVITFAELRHLDWRDMYGLQTVPVRRSIFTGDCIL